MGTHSSPIIRVLHETAQNSLNCKVSESGVAENFKANKSSEIKSPLQSAEDEAAFFAHITPLKSNVSSRKFIYITSFSRVKLPLAWLNISGQDVSLPPGHQLKLSKPVGWEQNESGPIVAAVKLVPENEIYVLESVSNDTCVACGLWKWVTEEHLKSLAGKQDPSLQFPSTINTGLLRPQTVEDPLAKKSPKKPRNRKGVQARKALLPEKENTEDSTIPPKDWSEANSVSEYHPSSKDKDVDSIYLQASAAPSRVPEILAADGGVPFGGITKDSAAQGISNLEVNVEKLATQYQETLYLSKASVAFFAKGPLGRLRNAHLQRTGNGQEQELFPQFLQGHILPEKKLDAKYRDTLPAIIRDMSMNRDACGSEVRDSSKRSRKKARKPGKDGLLGTEPEFVRKWWQREQETEEAVKGADVKSLLRDLQSRETQLQILYMLEALILEQPNPVADVKREEEAQFLHSIPTKSLPKRKKVDLNTGLENLLDRLCIWHAVGGGIEALAEDSSTSAVRKKPESDKLREFCIEVIIPFYGAKLPMQCKMISRKLGGPADVSTARARPPLTKSASTSAPRPGSTVQARRRPIQQQSLQRVLSDERGIQRSRSPSIGRSSTMPLVPALKREPSESASRPGSRGSLSRNIKLDHREVDLVAVAKQQHNKLRRINSLVEQQKELDAAISALRKPNRTLQARDFVDSIEKRTNSIPSKEPRKRLAKEALSTEQVGIQVTSTPKKPRLLHTQPAPSLHYSLAAPPTTSPDSLLLSSPENPTTIPSSSRRPASSQPHPHPHLPPSLLQAISTTPSTSRTLPPHHFQSIQATPLRMTKSKRIVEMTPMKREKVQMDDIFRSAPVLEKSGKEVSIYESLGWDDDDEEDELI
ncbi:MAG: hypothetical protein Q9160_003630 [Pyrenula sp. 1 TL-2023]